MSNAQAARSIVIPVSSRKTVLSIQFPYGRVASFPIHPIEQKLGVAPDKEVFDHIIVTPAVSPDLMPPVAPFGLTVVQPGEQWSSPDQIAIVAQIPLGPVDKAMATDCIIRHQDGSSETIRFIHAPGQSIRLNGVQA